MRRTLLAVIVTVCVMLIGGMAYINKIENSYETKARESEEFYERVISSMENHNEESMNELTKEYEDLEDQVWNMMNDEAYEVRVHHDGKTYIYESDNKGLFPSKSVMIIH
jgi:predicted Holliday junction resolvase-like endonuclease